MPHTKMIHPKKLLAKYKVPEELAWLGICKEMSYIDSNNEKKVVRFKNKSLACADDRKKIVHSRWCLKWDCSIQRKRKT